MSMTSEEAYSQEDIAKVLDVATEPSYLSEISRKLIRYDPDWGYTGNASLEKVAIIASMMDDRDDVEFYKVGYDTDDTGQSEASPLMSLKGMSTEEGYTWEQYTVMHYTTDVSVDEPLGSYVDQSVTPEEKIGMIKRLSSDGNEVSRQAEEIMQDTMERQFRRYDKTESPDYNDPGVDFYVEDERNREWGLSIEVSVRWVNPIDDLYITDKKEKAFDKDSDLLVLAPKFTDKLLDEYENPENPMWNADPLDQMVHLHRVPSGEPSVYYPFAKTPDEIKESNPGGNPVIIPDDQEARKRLKENGNVGDDYPIVDNNYGSFIQALDYVNRDFTVVTESQYRNELRESIEPLLWEFLRPYKIEQFLVDMYWDKELTQSQIGKLVDRTGGTIGEWMRKHGVMRRGTGAPELSRETVKIWKRMYRGKEPFPEEFSGYRILAEYNRHPLWDLEDWEEWYEDTTPDERQEVMASQGSFRDNIGYTLMFNPQDRLQPSYSFVLKTLKENGVEVRNPDEAPRVPYSAYPNKDALEYMLNKNQDTIVDVDENSG